MAGGGGFLSRIFGGGLVTFITGGVLTIIDAVGNLVTKKTVVYQQQHKINAVIFTDRSIMDNIKTFLLNMRSALVYQDGRYRLTVMDNGKLYSIYGNESASVLTINEDDIIDGIRIEAESAENKYNRVVITYMGNRDGSDNMTYEPIEYTYPEADSSLESQYLAEDGGRLVETRITLEHITEAATAAKLAKIILERARTKGKIVTFQGGARLFQLEINDIVTLSYSSLSISGKFRVKNIVQNTDFTFQITLNEHDDIAYAYNPRPVVVKGYNSTFIGAPIIPPNVPVLPTPPWVVQGIVPVVGDQTSMGGNVIRIRHTNVANSDITGLDAFIRRTGSNQDYQFHQGFSNFAGLAGQYNYVDLRLPINQGTSNVTYDVIYKYSYNYGSRYGPATVPYELVSRPGSGSTTTTNGATF